MEGQAAGSALGDESWWSAPMGQGDDHQSAAALGWGVRLGWIGKVGSGGDQKWRRRHWIWSKIGRAGASLQWWLGWTGTW
jgi:hypothetical protein